MRVIERKIERLRHIYVRPRVADGNHLLLAASSEHIFDFFGEGGTCVVRCALSHELMDLFLPTHRT